MLSPPAVPEYPPIPPSAHQRYANSRTARAPAKLAARPIRLQSARSRNNARLAIRKGKQNPDSLESMAQVPAARAPTSQAIRAVAAYLHTKMRLPSNSAVVIKSKRASIHPTASADTPSSTKRTALPRLAGQDKRTSRHSAYIRQLQIACSAILLACHQTGFARAQR